MRRSPFETWMFLVVFWILCSWRCLADWQVSCSRYVVQLQQKICHRNDCEHEWHRTFSPKRTWGSEQIGFLSLSFANVCHQPARLAICAVWIPLSGMKTRYDWWDWWDTIDMSWLETRAEIDLAVETCAVSGTVDKDEVRVMRVQVVVECRTGLILLMVIDRHQHW